MARVLNFLIRYFSNYYTLHRSDLAARAAPLALDLSIYFSRTILDSTRIMLGNSNAFDMRYPRHGMDNMDDIYITFFAKHHGSISRMTHSLINGH